MPYNVHSIEHFVRNLEHHEDTIVTNNRKARIRVNLRVDDSIADELRKVGAEIAHNPHQSDNDALYSVIGELRELRKELSNMKQAHPTV
jgi:hypothetical protein